MALDAGPDAPSSMDGSSGEADVRVDLDAEPLDVGFDGSAMDATPDEDATIGEDAGPPPPTPDPWVDEFLASVSDRHLASFQTGQRPVIWSQGAILEALLHAYHATGDERILDEAARQMDIIIDGRSSVRGTVEELRGRPVAAWPTDGYNCGDYVAAAVHTAVLVTPIAEFARIVLEEPSLHAAHVDRAERYLQASEDALELHRPQFTNNGDTGRYRHPENNGDLTSCADDPDPGERANDPLPFNMMSAMGMAHIQVGRALEATGASGATHLDRATRLARFFESHLRRDGTRYDWDYAVGGRPEDTAHAGLSMRFVSLIFAEGLHFSRSEVERFVATFRSLAGDLDAIRSHLDPDYGNGPDVRWQRGITRWIPLSEVDRIVYDLARIVYYDADGDSFVTMAMLKRFAPDAYTYPIVARGYEGLPVSNPRRALYPSQAVGLYRPGSTTLSGIDGDAISSCARWLFEDEHSGTIELRYRQTETSIAGDSCTGDGCDTDIGMLFYTSLDGENWERTRIPSPTDDYVTHDIETPVFRQAMACRGGAGNGRKNLQVQWIRVPPVP